jgi:hypothetical protein
MNRPRRLRLFDVVAIERRAFRRGVAAAAYLASDYNGSTTLAHRLEDCILMKLNQTSRMKPRINKKKLQNPKDAMVMGMVLALAEMHRLGGNSTSVCEVARDAGITLKMAKAVGCDPYDWKELKKAGVK